jgi:hypothetical protein
MPPSDGSPRAECQPPARPTDSSPPFVEQSAGIIEDLASISTECRNFVFIATHLQQHLAGNLRPAGAFQTGIGPATGIGKV